MESFDADRQRPGRGLKRERLSELETILYSLIPRFIYNLSFQLQEICSVNPPRNRSCEKRYLIFRPNLAGFRRQLYCTYRPADVVSLATGDPCLQRREKFINSAWHCDEPCENATKSIVRHRYPLSASSSIGILVTILRQRKPRPAESA